MIYWHCAIKSNDPLHFHFRRHWRSLELFRLFLSWTNEISKFLFGIGFVDDAELTSAKAKVLHKKSSIADQEQKTCHLVAFRYLNWNETMTAGKWNRRTFRSLQSRIRHRNWLETIHFSFTSLEAFHSIGALISPSVVYFMLMAVKFDGRERITRSSLLVGWLAVPGKLTDSVMIRLPNKFY